MDYAGSYKQLLEEYGKDYYTKGPYHPYMDFPRHDAVFERFIGMMNPQSVLDVGCAYGYIVFRCLQLGIPAIGLDVSHWCGLQKVIPGHYIQGSAWALPFKHKSFDVIFCEGVLEHIPEDKIEQVMSEFERVAQRGFLGVSYDHPETTLHLCNHSFDWWICRIPPRTFLGVTGESLDIEDTWVYKRV